MKSKELNNIDEVFYFLGKGAVVTLTDEVGFNLNIKQKGLINRKLLIESYGEYNINLLYKLFRCYNLKFKIFQYPPQTSYCPITNYLLENWQ